MKLKKLTSLLMPMVASLPFVAAACGGEGKKSDETTPTPTPTPSPAPAPVNKFNVTILDGTNELSKKEIKENKEFTIPETGQEKSGHIFSGFFLDKEFKNEAKPGSKITITADTTIYAKYITLVDYVKLAIKNTVGDKFKYNYELKFEALKLKAQYDGTVSYNSSSSTPFLKDEKTTGLLIKDGHNVHWIKDGKLHKISAGKNDKNPEHEEKAFSKPYESSIFAKILFAGKEENIAQVSRDNDKFTIKLQKSVSDKIKEFLESSKFAKLEKYLKGLQDLKITSSQISLTIDSKTKQVKSYTYIVETELKASNLPAVHPKLSYKLTFTTPDSEIKLPEIAQQNSN